MRGELAALGDDRAPSFPVVFDHKGVPVPQPIFPPGPPEREGVSVPTIVPVLLQLTDADGVPVPNEIKLPGGGTGQGSESSRGTTGSEFAVLTVQ